jgi:hypothetical protein
MDEAREKEIQQLAVMLSAITTQVTTKNVTGFLSMIGSEYSGQLMVVGRAVNGWTEAWVPDNHCTDARRLAYAREVCKSVTKIGRECPMSWVTEHWGCTEDYNTCRSAFWRVIRAVVSRLRIAHVDDNEAPWSSSRLVKSI